MSPRLCPLKEAALDAPELFGELDRRTEEQVKNLRKKGLREGDRLAVFLDKGLEILSLLFASIRIGAIFCPLNLRIPPTTLQAQLSILSPRLFISASGCEERISSSVSLPPSSFLLFTSGSSGRPKIACLTLENLLASAKTAAVRCNLTPRDGWLLSLPLFHVGGLGIVFRCLFARAAILLSPSSAVTHLSYVPTQLYRAWPVYPRLKCLLLGGGPISEIPKRLPIITSYALTETSSLIVADGVALPGKEIQLREGEIFVRGDSLFQGYFNGRSLDKPFDEKGWFATRDLGAFDGKKLSILGRKDNQFISGGENIQPEEIERELLRLPNVLEAIVVAKEDPEFGARPVAWIRAIGSMDGLRGALAERLPKYKIPVRFFSLDQLPENGLKASRKQIFELTKNSG